MNAKEKLIVALDVDTYEEAARLIDILKEDVDIFKVGIAPFTAFGDALLCKLSEENKKVFLDLKFHDIPNTVRNAARAAASRGVFMMNFHCLGGEEMLQAAREGAEQGAPDGERPILLGVTILTSMDESGMRKLGFGGSLGDKVMELAGSASKAGLDGVVASAHEVQGIRKNLGRDFVIVTPGVRPEWAAKGDQKRVMTPSAAVAAGADHVVVGRPIIKDDDPRAAARRILEEMEG
jgi:orotidine-5'-phosphate decarboxylase